MNDNERRDIERACEALSIAYARSVDFRDYDTLAELFAEDGTLDAGQPLQGRRMIRESLDRRPCGP
jgi:hypothetical protein